MAFGCCNRVRCRSWEALIFKLLQDHLILHPTMDYQLNNQFSSQLTWKSSFWVAAQEDDILSSLSAWFPEAEDTYFAGQGRRALTDGDRVKSKWALAESNAPCTRRSSPAELFSRLTTYELCTAMDVLFKYVDTSKLSLFLSLASITFNPTAWNIVARNGACIRVRPTRLS